MDQPVISPPARSRRPARPYPTALPARRHPTGLPARRRRFRLRRVALAGAVLSLLLTGCSGADAQPPTAAGASAAPAAAVVTGPLCDLLPSGGDPGNPTALTGQPADVALQWIPVLTTFEAAVRASGLDDLHAGTGLTILAPTDDAFAAKFSGENLDRLLLVDRETLRGLLREHLVAGSLSLADMLAAGRVTTLAGRTLTVTGGGASVRLADQADTVCADYRAAGARIHIIDRVLGDLPTTAGKDGHPAH